MNGPSHVQKVFPLSPMQEGILFQTLVDPNSEAYFEQLQFTVHGGLDSSLFQKSLAVLSERYEVFRTNFVHEKVRRPVQVVLTERPVTFQYEEITAMAETAKASYCETFSRADRQKGFDLRKESLVRVSVIRTHAQRYRVIWSFHHIIMDGWCIGIVLTDFFAVYQMLLEGRPPLLPKAPPYSDYIEWLDRQDKQSAFAHWEKYLDGYETIAVVPKSHSNPVTAAYCQAEHEISLDESLNIRLQQTAAQYHVTINTVCQVIWGFLLQRYNNTRDVVFGVVVSGRPAEIGEIERRVGLYINTIPVRIQTDPGASFSQLFKQVQQTGNTMERYSYFQLAEIQSRSSLKQDLIDHLYIFENFPSFEGGSAGDQGPRLPFRATDFQLFEQTNYHFNVLIHPGAKTRIKFSYNSNVHHPEWVRRIGGHFHHLLEQGLADPDQEVAGLDILTRAEKEQILAGFNQTQFEYHREKTIVELFEAQVARDPDSVAMEFDGHVYSYGELDRRSNQLARKLREKGARAGLIVAIMPRRSQEMLIGIMAILKAGAAYLPIDPEYPRERIEYMLADSQTSIILTTGLQTSPAGFRGEVVDLGDGGLYQGDCSGLERENCATDLAYIIYTSGSTGKPKGVMIEQRALHNFIAGVIRRIEFTPGKTILAVTTLSFDIFGLETLLPLTQGLTIIIATKAQQRDPGSLSQLIAKRRIRMLQFTPSRTQMLLSDSAYLSCLESVTELMIGGEALPESMVQELRKWTGAKIYNMYGPTETTIWSTIKEISEAAEITIGTPIANTQVQILDQNGHWQPVGIAGELCIAGDGLARGYLNRPELTAEKFVVRAFRESPPVEGQPQRSETPQRIYQTGDLARWLPEGEIGFLGRIDHQVKIRGYRIELGEIEARLSAYPGIKKTLVTSWDDGCGSNYLCAYLVFDHLVSAPAMGEGDLTVQDIRDFLAKELPEYMIPSYFIPLEQLPMTPNGKIDRKELPKPQGLAKSGAESAMPENDLEIAISEVWKEILNVDKIGVRDRFFDIGGNSLTLVKMNALLNQKLGRQVPTMMLYRYPTIHSLAQSLTQMDQDPEREDDALAKIDGSREIMEKSLESLSPGRRPAQKERSEMTGLEVAVIGIAGRFPGARNPREFWENLIRGKETLRVFTDAELEAAGVSGELLANPNYVKTKGILDQIEDFDAQFFGYSPADAQMLDPQVRIFMECVWEALEDAGYDPFTYPGLIGLYAGASPNFYWEALGLSSSQADSASQYAKNQLIDRGFLTTRVSYQLNLKGPSVFVYTACSTSLVAVHSACRALLTGECQMALAGGVSLLLPQINGYLYQPGMILAPDGHCRAFDAAANGTVGGEGAGVVLLKRLEDALADGDHLYAVIKGSAINNDGFNKAGYTAPGIEGQAGVIRAALRIGRVEPESVSYVETHGTGTALGDPIEIEALKLAFHTQKKQYCRIGSVKTNIGHTDTAAGIAGFIKTALALHHRQIPPSLRYQRPNPKIDFENSPFMVNTQLTDWRNENYPLRAGVSSFGIGGTNAHVVMEAAPPPVGAIRESPLRESPLRESPLRESPLRESSHPCQLVMISAKTKTALEKIGANLAGYLQENPGTNLGDFAYTLGVGRAHFPYRRTMVCHHLQEFIEQLSKPGRPTLTTEPDLTFAFPGQGSQYPNLGRELYENESGFREELDRCREILKPILQLDLITALYPANDSEDDGQRISETALTQPVIFSVEYALASLLMKWGLKPRRMIGHSIGEYVAACIAGVISLEDALNLVAKRGQLMQKMEEGAMLSVTLSETELASWITPETSLAAVNGPALCVVSGPKPAIQALEGRLQEKRIRSIRLQVSHAFHSALMEPALPEFREQLLRIKLSAPKIPYISNVTGNWIKPEEAISPDYWTRHLRHTVRFHEGLTKLLESSPTVFLEVGGGKVIAGLIEAHPQFQSERHFTVNTMRHPKETGSDLRRLLGALGRLWEHGVTLDWNGFFSGPTRRRLSLPTYPFERQRFWLDGDPEILRSNKNLPTGAANQKLRLDEWFYAPGWKQSDLADKEESNPNSEHIGSANLGSTNVLVFTHEQPFSARLVEELRQSGASLVLVKAGAKFVKENVETYSIQPNQAADYQILFRELHHSGKTPDKIIHLWMLDDFQGEARSTNPAGDLDFSRIETATEVGFYSLIYIAQAIGQLRAVGQPRNVDEEVTLTVITNNLQAVTGRETIAPEKALILGPIMVIPLEYSNLNLQSIDIEIPTIDDQETKRLIANLIGELMSRNREPIVAWRGRERWVPGFESITLKYSSEISSRLRDNGVYLITGGLGGIGLTFAKFLAETVRAKLVLTGRTPLPHRTQWGEWLLDHPLEDPLSQKIRKVRELEKIGGSVMIIDADISDPVAMQNAFKKITDNFGKVDGVIHCAGIIDDCLTQFLDRENTDPILDPKVKGTLVIDELFRDRSLDFLIICSSLASVIPTFSRVGYTAANSFLDAYARYKSRRDGTYTLAINWDAWQGVGMTATHSVAAAQTPTWSNVDSLATGQRTAAADAVTGLNLFSREDPGHRPMMASGILPEEGTKVLRQLLEFNNPQFNQLIVSTSSLTERFRQLSTVLQSIEEGFQYQENPSFRYTRPDLATPYMAPRNEVEAKLAEIWEKIFGIKQVGIHDHFLALGGDSLKALTLISQIRQELKTEFSLNDLDKLSTIEALASSIIRGNRPIPLKTKAEQGIVKGEIGLIPIQKHFLSRDFSDKHHWNLIALLFSREKVNELALMKAITKVVEHHDALRMVFLFDGPAIRQFNRGLDEGELFSLKIFDYTHEASGGAAGGDPGMILKETKAIHRSMDLTKGPLIKFGLFKTREGNHLSIAIHHLVADAVSLQFVIADLLSGYLQALHGQEIELPPKTDSLLDFSKALYEYANSPKILDELSYWERFVTAAAPPFPKDGLCETNRIRDSIYYNTILLDAGETAKLLDVSRQTSRDIQTLLLTGLGYTFMEWSHNPNIPIKLIGHGRESVFDGLDLTRTCGWISVDYPVALTMDYPADISRQVEEIAEILAQVPGNGRGHGILKFITPPEKRRFVEFKIVPEILFNFLGQMDSEPTENQNSMPYTVSPFSKFISHDIFITYNQDRDFTFQIFLSIKEGALHIEFNYNQYEYQESTITGIIAAYADHLRKIIDHYL